jgi:FKBP-type peptidyl-prolyl cis-trans isomerase SlpA
MQQENSLSQEKIAPGSRVTLHFSLANSDGTVLTSTFDQQPATIDLGDGCLTEGLELALYGLTADDEQTITLTPEQAFGEWNEEMLQTMPSSRFGPEMELEPGLVIAFETPDGNEVAGIVRELKGDQVEIDFNHPLAGESVVFRCKIIAVEGGEG